MKGNNQLTFNEASMMQILQFYFDEKLFRSGEAPTVIGLDMVNNISGKSFVVKTEGEGFPI